ncbi:hypothetical protein AB4072_07840 [Microvirga sp. 2MCAF38]|uniref:hypothetical protein n=1 Tax=Microvirga sp. 2MCAF38 TaxID=3232989 RepID=UPI003F99DF25
MRILVTLLVLLGLAAPAFAQAPGLPLTGRSERSVGETNRSIMQNERSLQQQQQNQIDNNQLRQRIDRRDLFTNSIQQPNIGRKLCPPGSVGC